MSILKSTEYTTYVKYTYHRKHCKIIRTAILIVDASNETKQRRTNVSTHCMNIAGPQKVCNVFKNLENI